MTHEPLRAALWLLVGFLATTFVADRLFAGSDRAASFPRPIGENQVRLLAYACLEEVPDVLLLGSSRVAEGFDALLMERELRTALGRKFHVQRLAPDGARPWLLHQCVREYVAPRRPPKLVVVGVEARYFYDMFDGGQSDQGLRLLGSSEDLFEVSPFALEPRERATWAAAAFRGLSAPWVLDQMLDPHVADCVETTWLQRGEARRPETTERPASPTKRPPPRRGGGRERPEPPASGERPWMGELDRVGFELLLDELAALDCEVVLVRMPVRDDFDREFQPVELARFRDDVVPSFAERGLAYFDLDEAPFARPEEEFRNQTHLGGQGARHLTVLFTRRVVAPLLAQAAPRAEGRERGR